MAGAAIRSDTGTMTAKRDAATVVVRAAAGVVAVLGGLAFAGWVADVPVLTRGASSWATLKPNTAVCLLAFGVGLWLLTGQRRRLAAVLAGLVAAVAGVTLAEYAADADLGVDELLVTVSEPGPFPGRMAGLAAGGLLLLSAGLVAVVLDRPLAMQVGALAVFSIGYVAVLGHVFDATSLYSFDGYKSMSLPTSSALTVAVVGLLATRPDRGFVALLTGSGLAERLTRRVVPALVVGAAAFGALTVAAERAGAYRPRFGTALLALAIVAAGVGVVWRAAVVIRRSERAEAAAAAELRELTERLQTQVVTLVETAPDAIVTVDAAGLIVAANEHAADMFGYPAGDLVGRSVDELVPERVRGRHTAHRAGFFAAPRLRRMDRTWIWSGSAPTGRSSRSRSTSRRRSPNQARSCSRRCATSPRSALPKRLPPSPRTGSPPRSTTHRSGCCSWTSTGGSGR